MFFPIDRPKLVLGPIKPTVSKLKITITLLHVPLSTTSEHYWVILFLSFYKHLTSRQIQKLNTSGDTYTTGKTLGKTTLASAKYS